MNLNRGIVLTLVPKGTVHRTLTFLCGMTIILAALGPIAKLDFDHMAQSLAKARIRGDAKLRASESSDRYFLGVAAPIIAEGDLMGCVMLLMEDKDDPMGEGDQKLAQTIASFLGQQMEG